MDNSFLKEFRKSKFLYFFTMKTLKIFTALAGLHIIYQITDKGIIAKLYKKGKFIKNL